MCQKDGELERRDFIPSAHFIRLVAEALHIKLDILIVICPFRLKVSVHGVFYILNFIFRELNNEQYYIRRILMVNTTGMQGESQQDWTLDSLSDSIRQLHDNLSARAKHAVNVALTLRNWLIGFYIAEYQMNGADRAKYGDKVVSVLSVKL